MDNAIKFEYKGKKYSLYFTRRTIIEMEENGFDVDKFDKLGKAPMSVVFGLFDGSFLAEHRDTDKETIDNIYDEIFKGHSDKLAETLIALYELTYLTLNEQSEDSEGNALKWTAPNTEELLKRKK
jgi:hypothetical protein